MTSVFMWSVKSDLCEVLFGDPALRLLAQGDLAWDPAEGVGAGRRHVYVRQPVQHDVVRHTQVPLPGMEKGHTRGDGKI